MFEELDDPSPDLRPEQLLPQVRTRGRALRRRRQAVVAGSAGTALALVAVVVLALPGGQGSTDSLFATSPSSAPSASAPAPTAEPTSAPTPEPTPEVTSAPTPVAVSPSPAGPEQPVATAPPAGPPPTREPATSPPPAPAGRIELRGDDLLVTRVGAPRAQAVAAVTAVLGPPSEDPSSTTRCVASMQEVAWPEFTLAFDEAGTLSGWTSRSASLRTPSGVTVGTTVARLREVYADRLRLHPPNPDNGDTYVVDGVAMVGALSGSGDTDRVVALSNGNCTGP